MFTLGAEIGRGSQGVVFRAVSPGGVPVAVKRFHPLSRADEAQVLEEFCAVRALRCPNVVKYIDLRRQNGQLELAMELVSGQSLRDFAAGHLSADLFFSDADVKQLKQAANRGATPEEYRSIAAGILQQQRANDNDAQSPQQILKSSAQGARVEFAEWLEIVRDVFLQLLGAVKALHATSLMHRDIKPDNVLIEKTVKNGLVKYRPKLIDFGVAKKSEVAFSYVGTVEYMAPEMYVRDLQQQKPYDKGVDSWGLGCVLFEMLAGYMPFICARHYQFYRQQLTQGLYLPLDLFRKNYIP